MFSKILVANRGEAAVRIIRTCKVLGIETVAIFSDVDRESLHVRLADESYALGPPDPQESYSNIKKVLSIAGEADVDGIHPGYGYLSENSYFASACKRAGVKFVGPSPHTLKLTENKIECRKLARKIGVPTLQGTDEVLNDPDEAMRLADEIGYPLILKSAFGGGGRGIREVTKKSEFQDLFVRANREAEGTFGKGGIYLERLIKPARHIEFQFVADGRGKVVYLAERDCSIQRRHQKLLEMTPSPSIEDSARKRCGEYTVAVARAIGAENIGTVEFLMDSEGAFYFIEVNARLQVEHPITEIVSSLDLVETQFRIASGEGFDYSQSSIEPRGAAIECRINAENPASGFTPSTGSVSELILPSGPGIRVDTALYPGCRVTQHYDSLVAKVIAFDRTLEGARRRMILALREFHVRGVDTTIPFHQVLLSSPPFTNWMLSTDFLERYPLAEGVGGRERVSKEDTRLEDVAIAAALIHAGRHRVVGSGDSRPAPPIPGGEEELRSYDAL
jgi:acetyl/propionyl-CoA carboxylase alpha subunit